jgi:ribonuclease D
MGLGRAVEAFLGTVLPKQARLQRFDWSRRPLPPDALEYATLDVAHLLALDDALVAKLGGLGRAEWLAEECALMENVRWEAPPPPEEAAFGAKGSFDLDPVALAIFRELWLVRERSAERMDRPAFKVIGAPALMALARDPSTPPGRIPGANVRWLEANAAATREAVRRGRETGGITHPSRLKRRPSPWTPQSRARWEALNAVRAAKAAELGIAPSTLWPTRSLEALCLDPGKAEDEFAGASAFSVRRWQRGMLAGTLREALAKALSSES